MDLAANGLLSWRSTGRTSPLLEAVPAVFLNTLAGITPSYRGVHGAYWALVQRQPDACGVTVHLVDAGIDTGGSWPRR